VSQLDLHDLPAPGRLQPGHVPAVADDLRDVSGGVRVDGGRLCTWCAVPIASQSRRDAIYCGIVWRKRAWRFGRAVPSS